MKYLLDRSKIPIVKSCIEWYRKALKDPNSKVLPHPEKDRWQTWDNNRLWCSIFFSIGVKGSSKAARDYLEPIEDGNLQFELTIEELLPLSREQRMRKIWEFGRGKNRLQKALGRFFSKPENFGAPRSFEFSLTEALAVLEKERFLEWFKRLDLLEEDRTKARELEKLPGANLKVSRDFLNDIGMTSSLIALDVHVLAELRENWGWDVPKNTPFNRKLYEDIEDGVRNVAQRIDATVLEIDKANFFGRMTGEYSLKRTFS